MSCSLCQAVKSGNYEEYGSFILIPSCETCHVPLIILKAHKTALNSDREAELEVIMREFFSEYRLRGTGPRSIFGHYHDHLLRKEV